MARIGHIVHWLARIVDDQGVGGSQQWHCASSIFRRIPSYVTGLSNTHVVGDGISGIIQTAGSDDIDCRWSNR